MHKDLKLQLSTYNSLEDMRYNLGVTNYYTSPTSWTCLLYLFISSALVISISCILFLAESAPAGFPGIAVGVVIAVILAIIVAVALVIVTILV